MTLIRWNRQAGLSDIFDDLFDKDYNYESKKYCQCNPKTNIIEKEDAYILELASPGMKKEDFSINLENNTLTIAAEIEESKQEELNYTRREFAYGGFNRAFTIPKTVDTEKIKADYVEGILLLELPKKKESMDISREIKIK